SSRYRIASNRGSISMSKRWRPAPLARSCETSKYWIASDETALPVWLKDGSFLWLSDRSGWRHIYHYGADGSAIKQVTDGKWEVRALHGVDEAAGWVYFAGTERSHIGRDIYRIRIDGTAMQRLSKPEGTHNANFSTGL